MSAEIKVLAGNKITCTLLKDAEGNDVKSDVHNIYALKWSISTADKYPVGVVSYLEDGERQGHIQIPGASLTLDLGNGWLLTSDGSVPRSSISYFGTKLGAIQYAEVDASRLLVDGVPHTKIALSLVIPLADPYLTVEFVNNGPVFRSAGNQLGAITRASVEYAISRTPACEAVLVIESET